MNPTLKKAGKIALIIVTPTILLIILFVIWFVWKKTSKKKDMSGEKFESNYGGPSSPDTCPVCGEKMVATCKCGGPVKHTMEHLQRGHGMTCKNGHRWSYMTADGKVVILDEKVTVPSLKLPLQDRSEPQ